MKFLYLLALAAPIASLAVENKDKKNTPDDFFRLNFNVHRGNSVNDMGPKSERSPRLVKRFDDSFEVSDRHVLSKRDYFDMVVENADTFYRTTLRIGSNNDENEVLVDTGSSDLWVMSHEVNCFAARQQAKRDEQAKRDGNIYVGNIHIEPKYKENATLTPSKTDVKGADAIHGKPLGDDIMSQLEGIFGTDVPFGPGDGGGEPITVTAGGGSGSGSGGSSGGSGGDSTNTCTSFGSFNTGESESFSRNDSAPEFHIEYADGTSATGIWGYDDVRIHNATVNDLSFSVANRTSSNIGVLGIGLPGLETTYSSGSRNSYQYENLPIKLRNQGIISKSAYSLYLGSNDAEQGTILFGAVDHAKYTGTLMSVPIVNSVRNMGYDEPIRLEINVDGIELSNSNSDSVSVTSNGYTALLDTGSTLSYFPEGLLENTASSLGLEFSNSLGAYTIDCDVSSDTRIEFDFSGVNISAPISDFTFPFSSSQCAFGILPQNGGNYILLGDNFLRNAYVVYDLEDLTISLAPINHTDEEDIEVIGDTIPGALSVSGAASSAYTGGTESGEGSRLSGDGDSDGESRESKASRVIPAFALGLTLMILTL